MFGPKGQDYVTAQRACITFSVRKMHHVAAKRPCITAKQHHKKDSVKTKSFFHVIVYSPTILSLMSPVLVWASQRPSPAVSGTRTLPVEAWAEKVLAVRMVPVMSPVEAFR